MTNKKLEVLLVAFIERHPHLGDLLCTDQGIRLMNVDSQIAETVLRLFTRVGVPILSVHDSFIAPYTHVAQLKESMQEAARRVIGTTLAVEASGIGLDEFKKPHEVRLDFQCWRQTARCEGYLNRMKSWEGRKGREIISYS